MSPWGTTRPMYFWNFGSNYEFLRWQMSIRVEKRYVLSSFCVLCWPLFFFCSRLWSFAMLAILRASPVLCPRRLWPLEFSLLEAPGMDLRTRFVETQWMEPLPCNVIFVIFWQSSCQTLSRRFTSFNDACIFWSASVGFFATGFPAPAVSEPYKAQAIPTFSRVFSWFPWTPCRPDR